MPRTAHLGTTGTARSTATATAVAAIPAVRPAPGPIGVPIAIPAQALHPSRVAAPPAGRRSAARAVVVDATTGENCPDPDGATAVEGPGASAVALIARRLARRGIAVTAAVPRPADLDLVVGLTGPDGEAETAVRLAGQCGARLVLVVRGLRHTPDAMIDGGLRRADRVIVPSESFRLTLRTRGVDPARVSVLPAWTQPAPGVLDRFEARNRLGWPPRSFIAVHPGPMEPDHDLEHLLTAATLLGPDSLIALTGDGPARLFLTEQARQVPNALVPAALDAEGQALSLVAADVLLVTEPPVPGRLTAPVELSRCLGAGRPVVAVAPLAGTVATELAHAAGAGLVVPPGEPNRLAGALLALHAAPTQRISMGLSAIAYAEAQLSQATVGAGFDLVVDAALG